ncbi:MAG TPA: hypothetical protein VER08_11385 [Pyrinomonadaceae bacterium]|nr:hypothetical protein [Pyrinomonadaceae bacterium]
MASRTQDEERLTRYLLRELPEPERERFEEEFFGDDDAFERALVAEDELVDAYARGELSARERARFEELFLASAHGRERVGFARALDAAVSDARPAASQAAAPQPATTPQQPEAARAARRPGFLETLFAPRFALAAVAVVVVAVSLAWLLVGRDTTRGPADERAALAEREGARRAADEPTRTEATSQPSPAQPESSPAQPAVSPVPPAVEQTRPAPIVNRRDGAASSQRATRNERRPPAATRTNDGAAVARHTPLPARTPANDARDPDQPPNTADATAGTDEDRRIERLPVAERNVVGGIGAVSFELTPGQVRGGGGGNTLAVSAGAKSVLLNLNVETLAHENYRAVIETADGREVWRGDALQPDRAAGARNVVRLLAVPARSLPPGDYVLLLSGRRADGRFEGVSDYSFRVVRK